MQPLVILWERVCDFLSQELMGSKKQAEKAKGIVNRIKNPIIKVKMFYLSDIFKFINELNLCLQGRKSDLITITQRIKGYIGKLQFWKSMFDRGNVSAFDNFSNSNPSAECIVVCAEHLQGLHNDFKTIF